MDKGSSMPVTPADLAASLVDTSALSPAAGDSCPTTGSGAMGKFDHPIYKKMAVLNGAVNRMTKQEMKEALGKYNLDTRGHKDVLKRRLKNHIRHKQLSSLPHSEKAAAGGEIHHVNNYSHIVVIDFEATCERRRQGEPQEPYWHEIIEFPAVLVNVSSRTVIDEFHSYVRPVINPVLTKFCTELTGITQETVNTSPTFPEVLEKMEDWMRGHGLDVKVKGKRKFAILTDGPWDMSRFMYLQCRASNIPFPRWALQWINVRKAYTAVYRLRGNAGEGKFRVNLTNMLEGLGIPLVGRLHSGIADTRNIASIAVQMIHDGFCLRINERLCADRKDLMPSEHAVGEVSDVVDEISGDGGDQRVSRGQSAVSQNRSEVSESSTIEVSDSRSAANSNRSELTLNRSEVTENRSDNRSEVDDSRSEVMKGHGTEADRHKDALTRDTRSRRCDTEWDGTMMVVGVSRHEADDGHIDDDEDDFIVFSDSNKKNQCGDSVTGGQAGRGEERGVEGIISDLKKL